MYQSYVQFLYQFPRDVMAVGEIDPCIECFKLVVLGIWLLVAYRLVEIRLEK